MMANARTIRLGSTRIDLLLHGTIVAACALASRTGLGMHDGLTIKIFADG